MPEIGIKRNYNAKRSGRRARIMSDKKEERDKVEAPKSIAKEAKQCGKHRGVSRR